jgi:hypothetical protein
MAITELSPRTDGINIAAEAFERGSKLAVALTVVKAVGEIIRHKSPQATILKGAVLATGLIALSAACDFGVNLIRGADLP